MVDEINYGILEPAAVADALRTRPEMVQCHSHRAQCPFPPGRALADTLTEMREGKHACQKGIPAQRGIEY
jgi:cob(I)alamin adenosyltransferase